MPVQGRHGTIDSISLSRGLFPASSSGCPRQQLACAVSDISSLRGILGLTVELTGFSLPYTFTYKFAHVFLDRVVKYIIVKPCLFLFFFFIKYLGHLPIDKQIPQTKPECFA